MISQKSLQGPCQHCGKTIRYPAHLVGTTGICPMCRQSTEFILETPPQEPMLQRRTLIWTGATILVLVLGLIATIIALNKLRNLRDQRKPATSQGVRLELSNGARTIFPPVEVSWEPSSPIAFLRRAGERSSSTAAMPERNDVPVCSARSNCIPALLRPWTVALQGAHLSPFL